MSLEPELGFEFLPNKRKIQRIWFITCQVDGGIVIRGATDHKTHGSDCVTGRIIFGSPTTKNTNVTLNKFFKCLKTK